MINNNIFSDISMSESKRLGEIIYRYFYYLCCPLKMKFSAMSESLHVGTIAKILFGAGL